MPCVACWAGVAAGEGGQSRSPLVPSGHRLREGTQRGLRGSYVFRVFMKRGMKSTVWWVFTKHQQRPFPRSRCEGAYPVCWSLHETFQPRPLSLPKPKTKTRQERRWCWGVISMVPAAPVRPAPYSFSSFISTMSVLSSAAGMSVMAESSPSTADSFSIFFFCFR